MDHRHRCELLRNSAALRKRATRTTAYHHADMLMKCHYHFILLTVYFISNPTGYAHGRSSNPAFGFRSTLKSIIRESGSPGCFACRDTGSTLCRVACARQGRRSLASCRARRFFQPGPGAEHITKGLLGIRDGTDLNAL